VPGLIIAGVRWNEVHTDYLLGEGLVQLNADRRVFVRPHDPTRPGDFFAMAVLVDDTFICSTTPEYMAGVQVRWVKRFRESSVQEGGVTMFGGVAYRNPRPGALELSCPRICHELREQLAPFPLPPYVRCNSPMAAGALSDFRTLVGPDNPLMGPAYQKAGRSLLGRGGWLALTLRFDAYPAFTFLASQIARNLTAIVWSAILRWSTTWPAPRTSCSPTSGKTSRARP
jgi:hypothetical protein